MNTKPLNGKVAAVTGASSGLGQMIAETLGAAGAHVFMCGRTTTAMEASQALIEKAGGGATLSAFDMRNIAEVDAFIRDAASHAGRLDILVNNAGLGHTSPIAEGDPEKWREMLEVNVLGLLVGCQSAIKVMRDTGSKGNIINISSTAMLRRDSGVYGATKYAVNCINATLRTELENDDIRVTSIMPGVFATNFIRNFDATTTKTIMETMGITDAEPDAEGKYPREVMTEILEKTSAMMGDPQDIANAVLYIIDQPININIEELVIRPAKTFQP